MIKRTLYFGNPAYLSMRLGQLVVRMPDHGGDSGPPWQSDAQEEGALSSECSRTPVKTVPIEDIGVVILDNRRITITQGLMEMLIDNNCAIVTCGSSHLPAGLMLPLYCNTIQNERFRRQLDSSVPLRKQLWQQTIQAKIHNQAAVLKYVTGEIHNNMNVWENQVRSGDADNMEARAAVYYWRTVFPSHPDFIRGQFEDFPNNLLNYGYAILRAIIARALVGSGLLPTLGIHHHNRYNAYCLADDIMEPYRPYVDRLVYDIVAAGCPEELDKETKVKLLSIPSLDVSINGRRSPLMVAASTTTASLAKCFSGEIRKIIYPEMT
ncbi:MAG: type II CRISPR-associated endonuclease Cas1 [Bacteroidales bacterium]|nr:type II CRISPR-associated endonuclease Cas1 [Bacteroidales bacterium]